VLEGTDAGSLPAGAALTVQQAGPFGYEPILVFGWRGSDQPDIRIPMNPENSWRNEAAAALYQYERTAGVGVLAAQTGASWGALTLHDLDRIDVLGLTLYPFFSHATPGDIPTNYLEPLAQRLGGRPIAITETGWPAEIPDGFELPWEASEGHQVEYLEALGRVLQGFDVPLVTWLYRHPLAQVAEGGLTPLEWNIFHSLSLRRGSGEKRPVHNAWVAFSPVP